MFDVCAEKCDQCLFSDNRIVSKQRMVDLIKQCRKEDTYFTCHKATIAGREACCRGFYDTQDRQLIQVAQRLGMVKFIDPTTGEEKDECSNRSN